MYLAVLGRQSSLSIAELEALFSDVHQISPNLATFSATSVDISRLGGSLKIAQKLSQKPLEYLAMLPEGKITFGISDYSKNASLQSASRTALKFKQILARHGRKARIVAGQDATLSTATSLHNGLSGQNTRKVELIKIGTDWYRVIGVQDIDTYTARDQARPARDAKVGMLPPKLAQILINLCGPLPADSTILDPFCGTGVVLQEALLMGYRAYGTDLSKRMVKYTERNLKWLSKGSMNSSFEGIAKRGNARISARAPWRRGRTTRPEKELSWSPAGSAFKVAQGDATTFHWQPPIDAVACEGYLGQPMSKIPDGIKLKEQMQECSSIVLSFLKNLAPQIKPNTPVTIAIPAWLCPDGTYSRLKIIDEISNMGYNVNNKSREGLLYYRKGQIVARDIIILRKQ